MDYLGSLWFVAGRVLLLLSIPFGALLFVLWPEFVEWLRGFRNELRGRV